MANTKYTDSNSSKIKLLASELGELRVKTDLDISEHLFVEEHSSYSKSGRCAEAFFIATDQKELIKAVEIAREVEINFMVIGLGSKVILPQEGFPGLVIKNRSDFLRIFGVKGKVSREGLGIEEAFLEAGSGNSLDKLASYGAKQGLTGLEELHSSVGSLGGSLRTNPILWEKANLVKVLSSDGDLEEKAVREVTSDDIILSVVFKLKSAQKD